MKGKNARLSAARRGVCEIMRQGMRVPTLPQSKLINVATAAQARQSMPSRLSWSAIFMKAYGMVAQVHAELRQAYISWPFARLYEHPHTACAFPVERIWQGERVVLFGKIRGPESKSLSEIDHWLRHFQNAPVEDIGRYRQYLRIVGYPGPLRRLLFWHSLHHSGRLRAKRFGTCVVSTLGDLGCEQVDVVTPLTTYFTFGPIADDGQVRATIVYDHRVMDGRTVARCLNDLEAVLNEQIVLELEEAAARPPLTPPWQGGEPETKPASELLSSLQE